MTDSRSPERDRLYSQLENEYGNVVYSHAAQDEQRYYLFHNPQTAIVVDMKALKPADATGFARWIEAQSGKKIRKLGAGFPFFWTRKK